VGVRVAEGRVVLTVENDGVKVGDGGGGSGLVGLTEGNDGVEVGDGGGESPGPTTENDEAEVIEGGGRPGLTAQNHGAKVGDGSGGSGLVGLRERLTAVGGELEAGAVDGDRFRVVATVPLPAATGAATGGAAS
ncbi:hypothetical protein ACFWP5_50400, partial [Streptomyces sp. NPDC058469]